MSDVSTAAAVSSPVDLVQTRAAKLAQHSGSSSPAQMKKAATDFEAILLAQWLEGAEKSFGTVPGGEDEAQDPGHDQFQGIAVQHIAQAVAQSGGVGIARMLLRFFERSQPPPGAESQPAKPVMPGDAK